MSPAAVDTDLSAAEAGSDPSEAARRRRQPQPPWGFRTFEFGMMAPALLVLVALSIIPFLMLIAMSFSDVTLLGGVSLTPIGFDNWSEILRGSTFWASWGRTIVYFIAVVVIELLLGFVFALVLLALARSRSVMLSVVLVPMFLAPVIVGLLSRFLFDTTIGLYAQLLSFVGFDTDVYAHPITALATVVLADAWEWTPLVALILLAGLTSVSPQVLEAASIDGAGYFRTLFSIVIPVLKPVILVALLIRSMDAVRFYDIITATTNGGPANATKIIPLRLYEAAFRFNGQVGQAAVIGITMLVFSIAIAQVFVNVFGRNEAHHGVV